MADFLLLAGEAKDRHVVQRGDLPLDIAWPPPMDLPLQCHGGVVYIQPTRHIVDVIDFRAGVPRCWTYRYDEPALKLRKQGVSGLAGEVLHWFAHPPQLALDELLTAPERALLPSVTKTDDWLAARAHLPQDREWTEDQLDALVRCDGWALGASLLKQLTPFLPDGWGTLVAPHVPSFDMHSPLLLGLSRAIGTRWTADLLVSNRTLTLLLAHKHRAYEADATWLPKLHAHIGLPQTELLRLINWPAQPWVVRLLRRLSGTWGEDYARRHLRPCLEDASLLADIRKLPEFCVQSQSANGQIPLVLEWLSIWGASPRLLVSIARSLDCRAYIDAIYDLVRQIRKLRSYLQDTSPLWVHHSRNQLEAYLEILRARVQQECHVRFDPPSAGHRPRLRPTRGLTPVDTPARLLAEAEAMGNCLATYLFTLEHSVDDQVWHLDGAEPVSVHVQFDRTQRKWQLVEAKTRGNSLPSPETMATIKRWLYPRKRGRGAMVPVANLPLLPWIRPLATESEVMDRPELANCDLLATIQAVRDGRSSFFVCDLGGSDCLIELVRAHRRLPWTFVLPPRWDGPMPRLAMWLQLCSGEGTLDWHQLSAEVRRCAMLPTVQLGRGFQCLPPLLAALDGVHRWALPPDTLFALLRGQLRLVDLAGRAAALLTWDGWCWQVSKTLRYLSGDEQQELDTLQTHLCEHLSPAQPSLFEAPPTAPASKLPLYKTAQVNLFPTRLDGPPPPPLWECIRPAHAPPAH